MIMLKTPIKVINDTTLKTKLVINKAPLTLKQVIYKLYYSTRPTCINDNDNINNVIIVNSNTIIIVKYNSSYQ